MTKYNAHTLNIDSLKDAEQMIKDIGSDKKSINIMAPKMITKVIKLENVILQDAIIIKQDMLSIGGDVAVPKNTFELHDKTDDILIIGNLRQLNILVEKLRRHYSRLNKIADELKNVLNDVK